LQGQEIHRDLKPGIIMFSNVGSRDRILRFLLAAILLYRGLSIYQGTALGIGLDIASALLAFSALFGFCGIYHVLGISTCQSQN
jgi:Protein of unknown function (DUF2892)